MDISKNQWRSTGGKAAWPAQKKRENQNFGTVMRLFVSYLFVHNRSDANMQPENQIE